MKPRHADCRKCIYFKPVDEMEHDEVVKAEKWVQWRRPGEKVRGWCVTYNRPVTYYTGKCFRYKPRHTPRPSRPLTEFMG